MIKIYRCAYVNNGSPDARVHFSGWVRVEGMEEAKAEILSVLILEEGGGRTPPIILGWEEMQLEADEV